jgi:hypothetical protein
MASGGSLDKIEVQPKFSEQTSCFGHVVAKLALAKAELLLGAVNRNLDNRSRDRLKTDLV